MAMDIINLTSTIVFIVDCVLRILVMGPCLFFDSTFNIMDFTLVFFNCVAFVTSSASFVSNFRVLRIFRLMRLYKVAYLMSLKEGQSSSDPSLGIVRFLSLLMELGKPIFEYSILLLTAIFVMSIIGMHVFGGAESMFLTHDPDFKDLTSLTLMWNGIFTNRMTFENFSTGFITLFNMSCLDGWYPTMWTFISSYGFESTVFFIAWIVISNWILQGLLTAFIIMEMERLAKEYIVCESIGNKILIQNILKIKEKQQKILTFNVMKKYVAELDGSEQFDAEVKAHVQFQEIEEDNAELPFLKKFFLKRKNYPMFLFKPGGHTLFTLNLIKKSFAFNLAVSASVIICVLRILNSSNGSGTGEFYFSHTVWYLIDKIVYAIFLAEMGLQWACHGMFAPKSTAFFCQPVNYLEFFVNTLMIIGSLVEDEALHVILDKFRIIRIAKLPAIITSFSASKSLNAFLVSLTASFTSLSSVVGASIAFIFFFAIIGVQIFKSLFNTCSDYNFPSNQAFIATDSDYPNGCNGLTYVNHSSNYSEWMDLYVDRPLDHFDNVFSGMNSIFRIFMLNEWQGIMYAGIDTTQKGYQPQDFNNQSVFLFFLPVLIIGLIMISLLIGVIYYHFIIVNTFTGYSVVKDYNWAKWLMNEPKIKTYTKVIYGSREALWVVYEELLPHIKPLVDPIQPPKNTLKYYLYKIQRDHTYKICVCSFMAFPLFLIICLYKPTYGNASWINYDIFFTFAYVGEYLSRLYVDGLSKMTSSRLGSLEAVLSAILLLIALYLYILQGVADLEFNLVKISVLLRSFRIISGPI